MLPQKTYTADRIFTGTQWLTNHAVVINQYSIIDIVPASDLQQGHAEHLGNVIIAPAFIDLQIYGAADRLLAVYPEPESLSLLHDYCYKGGAALCLPTVATNTREVFHNCINAVRRYWENGGQGVAGLHLEGPWINVEKKGAHIASFIHTPSLQEVKDLLEYGKGVIKMITLAPECCSKEVIDLILSYGIVISVGHSNATYEEAKQGFAAGISTVTHLYNAMSPLQHRQPGLVGATMDDERVMASIIPDGHHVDFAAVRIAKAILKERLFVITDAVTTTGEGYYKHQPAGDKYEADGILSGSALTMNKALQNLVQHANIETGEALRMCSLYPATVIGMDDQYGKIEKGYSSRLVVLDEQLNMIQSL